MDGVISSVSWVWDKKKETFISSFNFLHILAPGSDTASKAILWRTAL